MSDKKKRITENRRGRFEYHISDTYEAGIVLVGTEVKSLREGKVNMSDAYAGIKNGEAWLFNLHISPFDKGNRYNHEPNRARKLLLHGREIERLQRATEEKGLTIVPLELYLKNGKVKVTIGVGRGKKLHDKRATVAQRQAKRDMERAVKDGR